MFALIVNSLKGDIKYVNPKKGQRIAYIGTIKIPENYPPALLLQPNAPYSSLVLLLIPPTLCLFSSQEWPKSPYSSPSVGALHILLP